MKRRGMATVLAGTMVLSMLGGFAVQADEESYDPITIQFWNGWTGSDGQVLMEYVDKFNETNKWNITVEMDMSSEFRDKITTAMAADAAPALILGNAADKYTYDGKLRKLDEIWDNTDIKKEDFVSSYLDSLSTDDGLYGVPFQISSYVMYWNKDLFKKAGLDPETPPTSWDEWQQDAAKISDSTKNIYGSGISYDYAYQIAHIMQRFGGLAVTDDNGTWKANFENNAGYENFLNMYKDMVDDGDNPLEADTDSMMSAGQVGITVGGPWVTAGLDTAGVDYGIGLIPQGDAGDMNSVEVIGFGITTAASDAEKEAAYKFIEWWNTQDKDGSSPALEWSLQNGFPAYTYSVQNNKEYKANKKLSAMSAANPEAPTDFIVDSNFPGINSVLSDVIPEMINSVAFGNSSVEDALAKAQKSTQKIVDKYNK